MVVISGRMIFEERMMAKGREYGGRGRGACRGWCSGGRRRNNGENANDEEGSELHVSSPMRKRCRTRLVLRGVENTDQNLYTPICDGAM
jgi:hypothetical protein